jgi:hypothetical protein
VAPLKQKGDLAELLVAADLRRRGYLISLPYGEDSPYDLVFDRGHGPLERVQVKYSTSDGNVVFVRCQSHSLTNGKVRVSKRYTAAVIDWIAVYDPISTKILYLPASELREGRAVLNIRLVPSRNGQTRRTRWWEDYTEI